MREVIDTDDKHGALAHPANLGSRRCHVEGAGGITYSGTSESELGRTDSHNRGGVGRLRRNALRMQ
jgi:hypothetical protein